MIPSPNELVSSILSLTIKSKVIPKNASLEMKTEFSCLFPQKFNLKKIKKELADKNSNLSFIDILKNEENNFCFPISKNLLNEIKISDMFETENSLCCTILFFTFLQWIVYSSYDFEMSKIIFDSLLILLHSPKTDKNHYQITYSIIYYLIQANLSQYGSPNINSNDSTDQQQLLEETIIMLNDIMNFPNFSAPVKFFDLVDLITSYMLNWIGNENQIKSSLENQYFIFLINMIQKFSKHVPDKIMEGIAPIACWALSKYEPKAIEYVSALSKNIEIGQIISMLSFITLGFTITINENPQFPVQQNDENLDNYTFKVMNEQPLSSVDRLNVAVNSLFISNLENCDLLSKMENIKIDFSLKFDNIEPKSDILNFIISKEIRNKLHLLIDYFSGNDDICSLLSSSFLQCSKEFEHSYDYNACFLYVFDQLKKTSTFDIPPEIITNQTIFDPRITMFNSQKCKHWNVINCLRTKVISMLLSMQPQIIKTFIYSNFKFPLLFSELLYRIFNSGSNEFIEKNLQHIVDIIFDSHIYYSKFNDISNEINKQVVEAQTSIFKVIEDYMLSNFNNISLLFSNSDFVVFFVSLIFDHNLQFFVNNIFRLCSNQIAHIGASFENKPDDNCKSNSSSMISMPGIRNKVVELFDCAFKNLDKVEYVQKSSNLINSINQTINLIKTRFCVELYSPAIKPLCSNIVKISLPKDSQDIVQFMQSFFDFLFYCSKFNAHLLKPSEIKTIKSTIIKNLSIDQKLLDNIYRMIGISEPRTDSTPTLINEILQPAALNILLELYYDTDYMKDILKTILQLSEESNLNKFKMNENDIDINLIELFEKYRDNLKTEEEILDIIFSVFQSIANYCSSAAVVQRFIPLFCLEKTEKGSSLPNFHEKTVKAFLSLISTSTQKNEINYISLDQNSEFYVQETKGSMLNNDFSLCFWIYATGIQSENENLEYLLYMPRLCRFYDGQTQFEVFIQGNTLNISIDGCDPLSFEILFEIQKWQFISLTFETVNNLFIDLESLAHFEQNEFLRKVILYVDGEIVNQQTIQNFVFNQNIDCVLGGLAKDSLGYSQCLIQISQFAMFPLLTQQNINELFHENIHQLIKKLNPYFIFTPNEVGDRIELKNIAIGSVYYTNNSIKSMKPSPFADVFCKRCGVDLILPLVAQWDAPNKVITCQNQDNNYLPKLTLEIIEKSLTRSIEAQANFLSSKGFEILSFLLRSVDEKHICFEFYSKFLEIFNKIFNEDLKNILLKNIIINVELWLRTTPENHIFILDHWANAIFASGSLYFSFVVKLYDFHWCIDIMRIYYYYTKEEDDICSKLKRVRNLHLNVLECHKRIKSIARVLASHSFISSDFNYLINTIMTCRDVNQQNDYLSLLTMLSQPTSDLSGLSPIQKLIVSNKNDSNILNSMRSLIYLSASKNKDIAISSILILESAIRSEYFANSISNNSVLFDLIIHQMPFECVNSLYFDKLVNKLLNNNAFELFPLVSWMALNMNHNKINDFYSKLQPSPNYVKNNMTWCIWSIFTIFWLDKSNFTINNSSNQNARNSRNSNSVRIAKPVVKVVTNENPVDLNELSKKIVSFLTRCSIEAFGDLYSICDIIANSLNDPSDNIKKLFILELHNIISNHLVEKNQLNYEIYSCYVRHFLFYRRNIESYSPYLLKFYNDSPFSEQQIDEDNQQSISQNAIKNEIIPKILKGRIISKTNSDGTDRYSPNFVKKVVDKYSPIKGNNLLSMNKRPSMLEKRANIVAHRRTQSTTGKGTAPSSNDNNFFYANDLDTLLFDLNQDYLSYHFGLRLLPNTNFFSFDIKFTWSDVDLAKSFLETIENEGWELFYNKIETMIETTIFLSSYISLSDPDTAFSKMSKVDFHKYTGATCFYDINSMRSSSKDSQFPIRLLDTMPSSQLKERSINFLNDFCQKPISYQPDGSKLYESNNTKQPALINESASLKLTDIKLFEERNSKISLDIFLSVREDTYKYVLNSLSEFSEKTMFDNNNSCNRWQQLWQCFSIERAPWHRSQLSTSIDKHIDYDKHYKRDFTRCYSFFSPKMKKNFKFDQHVDASLLRDSGDIIEAKSRFEQYKEELKAKYSNDTQTPLFFNFELPNSSNSNTDSHSYPMFRELTGGDFYVCFEIPCEIIKCKVDDITEGLFMLSSYCIMISVPEKRKKKFITYNEIKEVYPRRRFHHNTAIEIFLKDGSSYLLNFPNILDSDKQQELENETRYDPNSLNNLNVLTMLNSNNNSNHEILKSMKKFLNKKVHLSTFSKIFRRKDITKKWINNEITNFEYLMSLNFYSGRSFNDISMYPVFPWVLNDYSSQKLDLNDPSIYRDFSKPIGALNEIRLHEILEKETDLIAAGEDSYLYASCYSCPLIICLYLLRMEPFTSMHIEIQGGKFDSPSRIFSSIKDTFNLCNHTTNDYRELIPEFFCMPEFLVNSDNFDLGSGISDVQLPPWASSPLEFIYLHRKALESDYVSTHLHEWIDLIWGYKQRGEAARESKNVFMKQMYDDVWDDENVLNDIGSRSTIEAILCHVGQIPPQLFTKPHEFKTLNQKLPFFSSLDKIVEIPLNDFDSRNSLVAVKSAQHQTSITIFIVDLKSNLKLLSSINASSDDQPQESFIRRETIDASQVFSDSALDLRSKRPPIIPKESDDAIKQTSEKGGLFSSTFNRISSTLFKHKNNDSENSFEEKTEAETSSKSLPKSSYLFKPTDTQIFNQQTSKSISRLNLKLASFNGHESFSLAGENRHKLIFIGNESHYANSKSSNNIIRDVYESRSEITSITSDKQWTSIADKDAIISIFEENKLKFTIPIFYGTVLCSSLSSQFHMGVFGTSDNSLLFCTLRKGTIIKSVCLGNKSPLSILITKKWGFVVVCCSELTDGELKYSLSLFSVNGDFIRETNINRPVATWASFFDDKGFDFIIMANDFLKVYIFEVFYMNINEESPIFYAKSPVISLTYLSKEHCALVVTSNGKITFIREELKS